MSLSQLIEEKRNEKRKEQMKKEYKKTAKTLAAGVTVGALAGTIGGVLLAPKSGKETINDIKDAAKDVNSKVKSKASTAKNDISEAKAKIKQYLNNKEAKIDEEIHYIKDIDDGSDNSSIEDNYHEKNESLKDND